MAIFEVVLKRIDSILKVTLALMMALLVIDVTWQVLTRFVLPQPSSFTEELARFLLIWISLLGGAYVYRLQGHLGFDLFVKKLPLSQSITVYRICCLLVAVFAISVLIVGGCNLVLLTWSLGQLSAVLNIPMALIYIVIPLSGVLFLFYSVYFFCDAEASNPIAVQLQLDANIKESSND